MCFIEPPSIEICMVSFSWLDWGCGFGGGRPTSKMPFLSCYIKDCSVNVIYYCWCWPWSIGWGGVYQVSYCKVTLIPTLHITLFGKKSAQPMLKKGQFIYVNYFKFFCMGDFFSLFFHFFNQSFTCTSMDS